MKTIFKDVNKILTKEIKFYQCPFCNRALNVYSETGNTGGVSCYECNWRVSKYSILINNKNYTLHTSFPDLNNRFQISFDCKTYSTMLYEEKSDLDYFINYYLDYSKNLIFM